MCIIKEINLKKPKIACETKHVFDDESNNYIQNSKSSYVYNTRSFICRKVCIKRYKPADSSESVFRFVSVNINGESQPLCLNILKTMRGGNHAKNVLSFMKGTYVLKIVTNFLDACTVEKGNGKLQSLIIYKGTYLSYF